MAVTSSDIVLYAVTSKPKSDTSLNGGDINSGLRVTFTDIVATDVIELFSADNSDSGNVVLTGRNAAGVLINETVALSGTTTVSGNESFERVISAISDFTPVGDVTLRDASTDTSIAAIYSNESGFERIFYDAAANATGGDTKTLYEKLFIKNNNSSTALNSVTVAETSTGLYTIIQFGLENVKQSSETTTDRTTMPTGVSIFGDSSSGLPEDGYLNPLDYQGVWLKMTLAAGTSNTNSFYRLQIDGVSA